MAPILTRFASGLRARFGERLREVTLFGSWARGAAHEDSDIDVLVVIDALTSEERREVWNNAYDLDFAANEELQNLAPICYATAHVADLRSRERRQLREIDREGIAL